MTFIRIRKALIKHFQNNFIYYFILFLLFILGVIIGSFLVKEIQSNGQNLILKISNAYYRTDYSKNNSKFLVFKSSFFFSSLKVLFLWFLGLVNLGFFIISIIITLNGFSIGFTVGYLVNYFGLKGFFISIFGIYFYNLFMIPAIIGIGALSMSMSMKHGVSFSRKSISNGPNSRIKDYSLLVFVYALVLFIGTIIEGFVSPIFLKYAVEFL